MANPHRGEVQAEIEGRTYTLRLSINLIAEAEGASGERFIEVAARLEQGQVAIKDVRWLLWAALRGAHPDLTQEETGDLLQAWGLHPALTTVLQLAQATAVRADPQPAEGTARGARRRTGRTSSSKRSA